MRRPLLPLSLLGGLTACSPPPSPAPALAPEAAIASAPPSPRSAAPAIADRVDPAGARSPPAASAEGAGAALPPAAGFRREEMAALVFVDDAERRRASSLCESEPGGGYAPCLFRQRFGAPSEAQRLSEDLYRELGSVVGLEGPSLMDGGYRGLIQLVPELPVGRYRSHLGWVVGALRQHEAFFSALGASGAGQPVAYRHRPIAVRFFRSVGRHTPAAFARGWEVAYNVEGSLNTSASMVNETLFHEIFHLNDAAHDDWSPRVLSSIYDAIIEKCGARTACLAPFAPHTTTVRGGTYYAFQPGNGVREYAAELSIRYYLEQSAAIGGASTPSRWKCRSELNARAWALLVGEFFGGIDRGAPCRT